MNPLTIHARLDVDNSGGDVDVHILAYTGGVMRIGGGGPVLVDIASIEIAASTTLLIDHDQSLKGVVGAAQVDAARGHLLASGKLSRQSEGTQRIKAIETACDGIGGGCEREVQQLRAQAIDGTITMEQLTARLLDVSKLHALRASRNAGIGGFQPLSSGSSAFDVTQQTIECALCLKAGREDVAKSYGDDVRNRADGLRKKSLFELQNLLFAAHGMPTFDNFDGMLRASGASTVSLPNTLGNTMGRMLDVTMRETPSTWRSFAAIKSVENFHAHMGIRPFFIGDLEELPDNGEVKHGTMDEGTYTWSVDQYAKMFTIGRKTFINDGVGFFDQVVPQLANAALRKQNDLVWGTILANAGRVRKSSRSGRTISPTSWPTPGAP
ncbi:MAG: hypothetical protein AB7U20_11760 [Planctomycetaceae bacterium]